MKNITFVQALIQAFEEEMRRDSQVFHLCGGLGPLESLLPEFGHSRVKVCPISEDAYIGAGIGAAGSGYRPIISPGLMTFAFTAMDQIVNQMAKTHYMLGGQAIFPLVLRASTGSGRAAAAQHCQSSHPLFLNLAGLKVVMPSTPYDAKGLMKTAIRDNNPVVFFEHQAFGLDDLTGPVPEEEYTIPFGKADIKLDGQDVTVIAIAEMVHESLIAAKAMESEGISIEILDPRSLVPLDRETIQRSVRKTGRVIVVDEACITGSAAAEIMAVITEDLDTFRSLKAPPKRVCAPDVPIPYSPVMESYCIPDSNQIITAIRAVLS